MAHNLHGDIPQGDLDHADKLLEMESHFYANLHIYGPKKCAKLFICLAHDWYEMGDDDKGSELLSKADKICPTYFEKQIKLDIEEDPDFAYLVESLTEKILAIARSVLG